MQNNGVFSDVTLERSGGPTSGTFDKFWRSTCFHESSSTTCTQRLPHNVRQEIFAKAVDEPAPSGDGAITEKPQFSM
jgi:hypothetical protein